MTGEECLQVIRDLAKSQGSYGRLLREIETADNRDEIVEVLDNANFNDAVDLILWIEG
ncbi:MAG: hypothetical protein PHW63_09835 [Alphaproteobacteria bacterium]|nr:hypothetical protein [Alphaproteobacteria bacterium]